MDGKTLRDKLVGSDDERAVSPVIGVILMVAITVILAAVIATLVMDFGDSVDKNVNAAVGTEVTDYDATAGTSAEVRLEVTNSGSADSFVLRGPAEAIDGGEKPLSISETGSIETYDTWDGTGSGTNTYSLSVVGVSGDTETTVATFDITVNQP